MSFEIGQKIVCLNDAWYTAHLPLPVILPVKGHIYTIRDFVQYGDHVGIRLVEIVNNPNDFQGCISEPSFRLRGLSGELFWRPVVKRKTDISIFTKLLNTAKEDA